MYLSCYHYFNIDQKLISPYPYVNYFLSHFSFGVVLVFLRILTPFEIILNYKVPLGN